MTDDYWEYIWWRAGHRLSSAMLNNFATQVDIAFDVGRFVHSLGPQTLSDRDFVSEGYPEK